MLEKVRASAISSRTAGTEELTEAGHQEVLLKAGALQNAILNSANLAIIATDETGVIQLFNVGAERMLGYTALELVNKSTPVDIADPQELIERALLLERELATTTTLGFEVLTCKAAQGIEDVYAFTYICKSGSSFPTMLSVTALRNEQDSIIGYLFLGTDNTQRRQTEEQLHQNRDTLFSLVENAPFGVYVVDAQFRMCQASAISLNVFSSVQPLIGRDFEDIVRAVWTDPFTSEVLARFRHTLETGEPYVAPSTVELRKDIPGVESYDWKIHRITLPNGQFGVVCYFHDITERKLAEEAIRESEERYRNLFNSMDEGFCIIEMIFDAQQKAVDWQFLEVNPSFEKQSGVPDITGKRMRELAPDHEEYWFEIYGKVALTGEPVRFVNQAKAMEGRWFDLYAFRIGGEQSRRVAVLFTDITERKQSESNLKNAMVSAENANRAKSDFLSGMSHELRTPLNAILGFAQLIDSGTPPPSPSQKRSLDQILKGGWYLLDLINEILDLALIESGKVPLVCESVSLSQLTIECRAMIEPLAQARGIDLRFEQCVTPLFVKADRTRVKQILLNLLSNAIKYNQPSGSVLVEYALSPPHSIRICVRDTGAGLSTEQLAQLFQPFNRLGKADTEQGTGIGLVVTKRLVELMGGLIDVESAPGVGSVFWIELPQADAPQTVEANADAALLARPQLPSAVALRTLLYVEDNLPNMELVEQLIARRSDMRLLSAEDGAHGIALARVHQPAVILMDVNLPGISGIQALKILREDALTAHIPVLAISANAMQHDIQKGLDAGFMFYLTKPIKVNAFMEALDQALEFSETG